jgi:DNA invertase Pin-like site-specific DNA recombinase
VLACQHCGEPAPEGERRSKTLRKLTEAEADTLLHNGAKRRTFRGYPLRAGLLFCWACKSAVRRDGELRDLMGRQLIRDMAVTLVVAGFKKTEIARALGISRRTVYDYIGDVWRSG